LYEVKIFDGGGNLLNIISPKELEKKSTESFRALLSQRDREHIMSLEDEEQALPMNAHYMV
ncbi:MAG: hypothetical protein ACE5EK_11190, partial [Nitrospinales bacterium]